MTTVFSGQGRSYIVSKTLAAPYCNPQISGLTISCELVPGN